MYKYLLLTRKNVLFCLAINEPSPIFALKNIAIFNSTNVRSKTCCACNTHYLKLEIMVIISYLKYVNLPCSFIFISNSFALVFKISAEA
ncbi:XXYS1_4_G0002630.mRNA.1.CDS.1 [Saccharomyces cerevisiae]|nr:XXYS1_4_G0002630.mRNA.1.CDS.1 [Saccharomyces cerevisiae]CAI4241680.1 AMH_1a_G0000810.mRNA.1.CDS.1 [Saccharomyces cerevisiae]CAI4244689.1 CEI_1a_G0000710.mRNA.1.CDS.1 [Saccharomyces cerevisiae]CAI6472872.1 AMH_1a_G0000810.mRNA.1.CDS.1 [Saccharomyces cerevisiae]CAI7127969.1 CEI_1a_G0000710.mRNA.1.CDS.1 [Saccharomyces cerevisiae]